MEQTKNPHRYLIIGASAAGVATALTLSRLNKDVHISLFSQELESPYNKCLLADYAHHEKTVEQITILSSATAAEKNIQLRLGFKVTRIDKKLKTIAIGDQQFEYDTLCIATGASAYIPPIAGITTHPFVFNFYTLNDVTSLLHTVDLHSLRHAVVIGAGLSGLECADALATHGLNVSIVERAGTVLGQQVDAHAAHLIQEALQNQSITFYNNSTVTHIDTQYVYLHTRSKIAADIIICASGVVPQTELAKNAGLYTENNLIVVDETMKTSDESIYASGDCIMVTDTITQEKIRSCSWPDAMQQGMIAAHNMVGIFKPYAGVCTVTSSAFFGVKFATCGIINVPQDDMYTVHTLLQNSQYIKVTVKHDQLCGFVLVGDTKLLSLLKRLVLTKQSFEHHKHLIFISQ